MLIANQFSVSYVRPESRQLFFIFTGRGAGTVNTLDALKQTDIGTRNLVVLRDPHGGCYEYGLSPDYPSLDAIGVWQQEHLAAHFPHVAETFCMGVSSGGLTAIHAASRLHVRAAWSFAGRVVRPEVVQERFRLASALYQELIGRPRTGRVTQEEQAKLEQAFSSPELQCMRSRLCEDPATVIEWQQLRAVVQAVTDARAPTNYHFYYTDTNAVDRECAEAFRGLPNVELNPIHPDPRHLDPDIGFDEPTHSVVEVLIQMRRWPTMFSEYLAQEQRA